MIEWCTKNMQVLEQLYTQDTFSMLKYIQEKFEKVKLMKQ